MNQAKKTLIETKLENELKDIQRKTTDELMNEFEPVDKDINDLSEYLEETKKTTSQEVQGIVSHISDKLDNLGRNIHILFREVKASRVQTKSELITFKANFQQAYSDKERFEKLSKSALEGEKKSRETNRALKEEIESLKNEITQLKSEIKPLDSRLPEAEGKEGIKDDDVEQIYTVMRKLEKQLNESQKSKIDLFNNMKKVQDDLSLENKHLKERLKAKDDDYTTLSNEIKDVNDIGVLGDLALVTKKLLWMAFIEEEDQDNKSTPNLRRIDQYLQALSVEAKEKINMFKLDLKKLLKAPTSIRALLNIRYDAGFHPGKTNKEYF